MNEYGHCTLHGNWFEERAPALNGVTPFYNKFKKPTASTTSSHYTQPKRGEQRKIPAGFIHRIRQSNVPTPSRIAGSLPTFDGSTTHATSFGERKPRSILDKAIDRSVKRRFAGGHPSIRPEKPMNTSGMIGEMYQVGKDPKESTAVQRSWHYSKAPELEDYPSRPEKDCSFTSLQLPSREAVTGSTFEPQPRLFGFGLTAHPSEFTKVKKYSVYQDHHEA